MCGIAEEVSGVDRLSIKLFAKVKPRFEHYVYTNFGISEEFYGVNYDPLGGLVQWMVISGSNHRDKSCFMFKTSEYKGFVFSNMDSIKLGKMLKKVSVFVDDNDMWSNGQSFGEMMNVMLHD